MTIRRHAGIPIPGTPYAVGAGYQGITHELDETVQRAAEMLADAFGIDVEIRFNTDRRSGGAWLVDDKPGLSGNASVGLCAGLRAQRPEGLTDEQWWDMPIEDHRRLPEAIEVDTYINGDHLSDPSLANQGNPGDRYASHDHATLEDGLAWLQAHATAPIPDMGALCLCGAPLREHRSTSSQCPKAYGQTFRPASERG